MFLFIKYGVVPKANECGTADGQVGSITAIQRKKCLRRGKLASKMMTTTTAPLKATHYPYSTPNNQHYNEAPSPQDQEVQETQLFSQFLETQKS